MNIEVEDNQLEGFNSQAKQKVELAIKEYADKVVEETLRIESARRASGSETPEVTSSIVDAAVTLLINGFGSKKQSKGTIALKVSSNFLWVATGAMFFSNQMNEQWFLILFALALVGAVITTTLSLLRD